MKIIKNTNRLIIVFLLFSFLIISCNNRKIYIMTFNGANNKLLKNYILYKKYHCKLTEGANYIVLDTINEEMLIEIMEMLHLKIDIIRNNIANVNSTRTFNGGSFTRQYLDVTAENGMEITEDTATKKRMVWDPTHPDAIRTGELTGYVETPNVDIMLEYYDLYPTVQLYNSMVDYIKNNYTNIIIDKITILSLEEMSHNLTIENIMEIQLKK